MRAKAIKLVAAAGAAATAMTLVPSPASATPSDIEIGNAYRPNVGYQAFAVFSTGSGHIRATMGCVSGLEHWTVYGPWKPRGTYSWTPWCAVRESNYRQIKNT